MGGVYTLVGAHDSSLLALTTTVRATGGALGGLRRPLAPWRTMSLGHTRDDERVFTSDRQSERPNPGLVQVISSDVNGAVIHDWDMLRVHDLSNENLEQITIEWQYHFDWPHPLGS